MTDDNLATKDISRRIKQAGAAFGKYKGTFCNKFKSLEHKVALYIIMVLSCLLQCIGVKCLLQEDIDRLETFHYRKLRAICGWSCVDFKSPRNEVYKKAKISSIQTLVGEARILWAAKVMKLPNYRIPKLLMMRSRINVDKKTFPNLIFQSPHKTWKMCLDRDLKDFGMEFTHLLLKSSEVKSLLNLGKIRSTELQFSQREDKSRKRKAGDLDAQSKKESAQIAMKETRNKRVTEHKANKKEKKTKKTKTTKKKAVNNKQKKQKTQ